MSLDPNRIALALGKLIAWLETWRTEEGAYLGFVVHRSETKRMNNIHDTAWTQAAMIRGYANLHRKSKEERWRERLQLAADLQASRFEPETGKFRYAGHEDDRFCSLVHCALAGCALLEASTLLDAERARRYIEIVRENVERYWLPKLWVEEEGAFRFSEIDYYSPDEDRFVLNFNGVAAECLLLLSEATGIRTYTDFAHRIGEWLIEGYKRSSDFYRRNDRTDGPTQAPAGGLPYQSTPSQRDPDDCVTIYAGLSLRGIVALYDSMNREELGALAKETARFLLEMRDPATHLFYHTARGAKIEPYPQFVSGAGMTLAGLLKTQSLIGSKAWAEDTHSALLEHGYPNGSYPNFIGKDANRPGGRSRKVWEDAAAGTNWNAQLFEYLTLLIDAPTEIEIEPCSESSRSIQLRYYYCDSPRSATILSWWPPKSWGAYQYDKRNPVAKFHFDPRSLYRKLRGGNCHSDR